MQSLSKARAEGRRGGYSRCAMATLQSPIFHQQPHGTAQTGSSGAACQLLLLLCTGQPSILLCPSVCSKPDCWLLLLLLSPLILFATDCADGCGWLGGFVHHRRAAACTYAPVRLQRPAATWAIPLWLLQSPYCTSCCVAVEREAQVAASVLAVGKQLPVTVPLCCLSACLSCCCCAQLACQLPRLNRMVIR